MAICSSGKSHHEMMSLMCAENLDGALKWPARAGNSADPPHRIEGAGN